MPYKDPTRKREWELRHRAQRLARRRELRRIESASKQAQPVIARVEIDERSLLLWFLIIGAFLALTILGLQRRPAPNVNVSSAPKTGLGWLHASCFLERKSVKGRRIDFVQNEKTTKLSLSVGRFDTTHL